MTKPVITPDEAKADFVRRGITIKEWCDKHNVNYQTARDILNGRIKGRSGEAHRVAVLLGVKDGVLESVV